MGFRVKHLKYCHFDENNGHFGLSGKVYKNNAYFGAVSSGHDGHFGKVTVNLLQ